MADSSLDVIKDQVREAIHASKCHPCGCFQNTVEALAGSEAGRGELNDLNEAKAVFAQKEYDCLGCTVCYPANAANAFAEIQPAPAAGLDLCPTEEPHERTGWPLLPGDYHVVRYQAPVAVCALNSSEFAAEIGNISPAGLSLVGTMHTENLGIERVIRNVNSNPHIRFLVLCGQDTQQQVGHLPGQSLAALFGNGLDERSRIIGARGKRPVLKNVTADEIATFRRTVELIDLAGEQQLSRVADQIVRCAERNPGATQKLTLKRAVESVIVGKPGPLVLDAVLEGQTAGTLYHAAITRRTISRLDHARLSRPRIGTRRTMSP